MLGKTAGRRSEPRQAETEKKRAQRTVMPAYACRLRDPSDLAPTFISVKPNFENSSAEPGSEEAIRCANSPDPPAAKPSLRASPRHPAHPRRAKTPLRSRKPQKASAQKPSQVHRTPSKLTTRSFAKRPRNSQLETQNSPYKKTPTVSGRGN